MKLPRVKTTESHEKKDARQVNRCKLTGVDIDGVGLPPVLGDLVVDGGHDVGPDGGAVHGGQGHSVAGRLVLLGVNRDARTGRGERLEKFNIFQSLIF